MYLKNTHWSLSGTGFNDISQIFPQLISVKYSGWNSYLNMSEAAKNIQNARFTMGDFFSLLFCSKKVQQKAPAERKLENNFISILS